PVTTLVGSTTYYVSSTIGTCEGPRAPLVVAVHTTPPAPTTSPVVYCQNATPVALTATGTNLLWYTVATGGVGTSTAPTPVTTVVGNTTYYVSSTIVTGLGTCEGPRASLVVTVNTTPPAPTTSPVVYCQNATAVPLTATGTNLLWYTVATGGVGTSTAPTPVTTVVGSKTYYVSSTIGTCEGPRASLVVTVNTTPPAPTTSPVVYCQNATAVPLTATGTNLLWYTVATGGAGTSTAPTPVTTLVGSTTYYVSSTIGTCEGPRAPLVVAVHTTPPAPTTSPVVYCQNATPVALTATGTNLLWYTVATGGVGTSTAPTPVTTVVGNTTYYVSSTIVTGLGSCEGPRASLIVTVNTTPLAPTASPVVYCQNATAVPLTATGTNLLWYTVATGGVGTSTAPTPVTTAVGNTTYYVSSTIGTCEGPRAPLVVTVNTTPPAPTTSPVVYCQNATAVPLSATGTNLLWYTVATGGVGTSTAPTPVTTAVGNTTYYASSTIGTCEGPRAPLVVTVNTTPPAPTTSPVVYCQNATAVVLTATGTNLLWYTLATGGVGTST